MADCPDVHPDSERNLHAVPGSAVMAQEYVETLPEEKQRQLQELEARGELRIAPRSELSLDRDRSRFLPGARKHLREHPDES